MQTRKNCETESIFKTETDWLFKNTLNGSAFKIQLFSMYLNGIFEISTALAPPGAAVLFLGILLWEISLERNQINM